MKRRKFGQANRNKNGISKPIMEVNMISLKYGAKGQPYLDLGKYGHLIFSNMTAHDKGFKYFAYVNRFVEEIVMKNNTTNVRTIKTENGFDSYMFNKHFKRNEKGTLGVPNGTIPRKAVTKLHSIISQFLVEDTYMPRASIKLMGDAIESVDWDKLLKKYQKKKQEIIIYGETCYSKRS